MGRPEYAELLCQSAFSFREGASLPEELVERAHELGLAALGICDRDGVHGLVRAWRAGRERGLAVPHGALLTLTGLPELALYAEDLDGWGRLCALLTRARAGRPRGAAGATLDDLLPDTRGLVALAGGDWAAHPEHAGALADAFGDRLYLAAARLLRADDAEAMAAAEELGRRLGRPVIATCRVLLHDRSRKRVQDVLSCLRHGVTLAEAGRLLEPNAERCLRSPREMTLLFRDRPGWVRRTLEVAERCRFRVGELRYRYPAEVVPPGMTAMERLRQLVAAGAARRWPGGAPAVVRRQLEHELALIEELDFPDYFLTIEDLVAFARGRGILCQGRGSAANSAVCFALGITSVDPTRSSMVFGRFISRERNEPPDIDVDFEHQRREEVIQYLYRRYGRHRAAMVNEVICWRTRSALRGAGKALGLAPATLDRLARGLTAEADDDPQLALARQVAGELSGLPRHTSIHVGGFVIAAGDLRRLVPVEPAAMPGRTVIQWDRDDVHALRFVKVDVLGLGILTAIARAHRLIARHHGRVLDLASLPPDDPAVFDQLCAADTVGVFQVESRAQMAMLPRLRPRSFFDLVVEISLVRPGPIQGGMVRPYLERRAGRAPVLYPHPDLEPILERTYGVPIFQEQVMSMAMAGAGYSGGEADRLRRSMGTMNKKGNLEPLIADLVARMETHGITRRFALRVAEQIRGFGDYGFPESHATSFALLVYASAALRRYWPAAWAAAVLNSQPMGFYPARVIAEDARRHGVPIRPICAVMSGWDCTLEPDGAADPHAGGAGGVAAGGVALRLGLRLIRGFGEASAAALLTARESAPFEDLPDLARRTGLDRGALRALARADALAGLGLSRRAALWEIEALWTRSTPLLVGLPGDRAEVSLPAPTAEERLWLDYRATGFSLDEHPVAQKREALGTPTVAAALGLPAGSEVRVAGMVICRQRPRTAGGVIFLTAEDETGMLGVIARREVYERYALLLRHEVFLVLTGVMQDRDGARSLLVSAVERLEGVPVRARSRDFR